MKRNDIWEIGEQKLTASIPLFGKTQLSGAYLLYFAADDYKIRLNFVPFSAKKPIFTEWSLLFILNS